MGSVEEVPFLSFKVLAEGLLVLRCRICLEKHLLVAVRTLKKLFLTVSTELMDSLLTFVSYFVKIDAICVRSSRLILCEEFFS